LLALALVALGSYGFYIRGARGPMVDVDLAAPRAARFEIDINTADAAELMLLPEIGPALAERIVADRQENGPFGSRADLDRVRGIGPATLERVMPYLRPVELEAAD
jgi:competence protein ComEA